MSNYQTKEEYEWNPFIPTERDIKRTKELAAKNSTIAAVLTFLLVPLGMAYLNRGINSLKIFGYAFVLAFVVGMSASSEEEAFELGNSLGFIGAIAASVEQVMSITEARKRRDNYKTSQNATNDE